MLISTILLTFLLRHSQGWKEIVFNQKKVDKELKLENLVFLSLCQDMQYLLAMLCGNVFNDDIQEQSSQNIGM